MHLFVHARRSCLMKSLEVRLTLNENCGGDGKHALYASDFTNQLPRRESATHIALDKPKACPQ